MKILWVLLNLTGLALIIGGSIYAMKHKDGIDIVFVGMAVSALSVFVRARVYRNRL